MRRATIATGLTLVLLAATTSSASAATFTPATGDFGKVPVGGQSAPQIFTLTKSSTETSFDVSLGLTEHEKHFGAHARFQALNGTPTGGEQCPTTLTDSFPSCKVWAYFTPTEPGRTTATIFSDTGEYGPPQAGAPVISLSGVGVAKKCKKAKKGAVAAKKKKCKKKK